MVRPLCSLIRTASQTPDISSSMSKSLPPSHLATAGTVISSLITLDEQRSPRLASKTDDKTSGMWHTSQWGYWSITPQPRLCP